MTGFDAAKAYGGEVKAALAARKPNDPPPRRACQKKAGNARYAGTSAGFREYLRRELEK